MSHRHSDGGCKCRRRCFSFVLLLWNFGNVVLDRLKHCGDAWWCDIASIREHNSHRDILRKLRNKHWPKLYRATVRVWNRKLQARETVEVPVLLPHEVLNEIANRSDVATLCSRNSLTDTALAHIGKARASMGDGPPICCLGLWMDGTPCNWDRNESVETLAISIPNLTGADAAMIIPFAVIMATHCISHETLNDLLEIFAWSLKCLALGVFPETRHDSSAFQAGEQHRARRAKVKSKVRAILTEVRADRKCLKEVFKLPRWQENAGCCWKCTADHGT